MELRRQRIHEAQRAGIRNRLLTAWRLPEAKVEELLAAWDAIARERGLAPDQTGHWAGVEEWLRLQVNRDA